MKNINKIITAGMTALMAVFGTACSDDSGVSGATTEPNSSPMAQLTEEQVTVLARVFSSNGVSASNIFESATYLSNVEIEQRYSYPSKDGRRTCDVVRYNDNNENLEMGVLRAFSYDSTQYVRKDSLDYMRNNKATLIGTQILESDGVPVVLTTVFSRLYYGYWRNEVSCSEYMNQFRQSCVESNGLFRNFSSGCHADYLFVGCAKFAPQNLSADELMNSYTEEYKNECVEDSIHYAPRDDENYINNNPDIDDQDGERELYTLDNIWTNNNLLKTLNVYRWQFTIVEKPYVVQDGILVEDTDGSFENDSGFVYKKKEEIPRELTFNNVSGVDYLAYNELPEDDFAKDYRNEGVYYLPDSLLSLFFPKVASRPKERKSHSGSYYMIVLKDVGAKGHVLTDADTSGIYVTDIVKSGDSCQEDNSIHYSAILVNKTSSANAKWNILETPIVKTTYVSDNWNCNKPESLEKIEPYGEWSFRFGELCRDSDGGVRVVELCTSAIIDNTLQDYPLLYKE